jgi:5-methyltetrahydrofolate corrinoid/iron sulfur protein methyltransferase
MITIADNLNTRNKTYMDAVAKRDKKAIAELAAKLKESGADMINLQCSLDGAGDEESLPWLVEVINDAADTLISLDSRNIPALRKAVPLCEKPPLINFISKTEPDNQGEVLSLASHSGATVVLRASGGAIPSSLEAKMQIIETLLEMANEADIPNERIFVDPSLVHIGRGMGQKHLVNSHECVTILRELIEPRINTIAWISNISTGLPKAIRKPLEASLLTYMAGAGLNAAMVDILDPDIRKAIYLIKAFRDEIVFSRPDIS